MYVCDSKVHKDDKGNLKESAKAAFKARIWRLDEDQMYDETMPLSTLDLCDPCYMRMIFGAQTASKKPPQKKVVAKR
jgi:hypothetical protein